MRWPGERERGAAGQPAAWATLATAGGLCRPLKKTLEEYCRSRGIVMNHFIQEAILDRLEEFEDIEDLKKTRHEPTRRLAEVLAELKRDGAL